MEKSLRFTPRLPVVLLALVAATFIAFLPVGRFDFINQDDGLMVSGNARVQGGLSGEGVRWAFSTTTNANWHPVTWLSHMLDVTLFGVQPGPMHLVNLGLHLANAALLLLLLNGLTGALWRSALVAALFALHPLHVESVAWIAERKDLLSSFFWMLAALGYLRYVRRPGPLPYLLPLACFALGLMAKAMVMTFPVVLVLLDFWPLGRLLAPGAGAGGRSAPPISARRVLAEKAPFLLLAGASLAVTYVVLGQSSGLTAGEDYPFWTRIANAPCIVVSYLLKTLWPARLSLLYHQAPPHFPGWQIVAAGTVTAAITLFSLQARRRSPQLGVGWLWYLVMLAPTVGIVHAPGQTMGDRYTYLPLVGVFVVLLWSPPEGPARGPGRRIAAVFAATVVLILAGLTRIQVAHWRDALSITQRAVEVAPGNAKIQAIMGYEYYRRGDYAAAARHYTESVRLQPAAKTYNNLGLALRHLGDIDGAIASYREALRIAPENAAARTNLANALAAGRRLP